MFIGLKKLKDNISITALISIVTSAAILIISLVIFLPFIPYSINWKVGQIAPETIVSPRFLQFESKSDKQKTQELIEKRKAVVQPVYNLDLNINKDIVGDIISFFTVVKEYKKELKTDPSTPLPEQLTGFSSNEISIFLISNLNSLEYFTVENTEKLLAQGLNNIDPTEIETHLKHNLKILSLGKRTENVILKIILNYIHPNLILDRQKSNFELEKELKSIKPFLTAFKEGQPIIYKGEKVTQEHIETLQALNIYGIKINLFKLMGIFLSTALFLLVIERFIFYFYFRLHQRIKYFILIFSTIFLLVISALFIKILTPSINNLGDISYLIPIPLAVIAMSFLVTPNISMLVGTITSILICIMFKSDMFLFFYLFFSTCISTFATNKKYRRVEIMKSGNIIGLASIGIILAIGLIKEIHSPLWYLINFSYGFLNGVVSAMLALAFLPYLELFFKITTPLSLLEFANLNHPLLKRLMLTAPGTYQHSLMVANLAEAATEAINGNSILARTASYFHDIGKMRRPIFFAENQFGSENPHKTLTPRMSKIIISSHTKEGVEIAQKYKLPKVLHNFILSHHGTSLVSFFYSQAVQTENPSDGEPAKEEFRYSGPKPYSKEEGILMLADSCEASVRSLEKPTPQKIEATIDNIFRDKIEDKQFSECNLDLREIEITRNVFLEVFKGIYHSRLDYQEELDAIMNQKKIKNPPPTAY